MLINQPKNPVKIMVFGTFDGLHPGHLHFFQQARSLAGKKEAFLIVSIARDVNVARIKGRPSVKNEKARLALMKNCKWVDRAILSGIEDHLPHILKARPNIIALGYDQEAYVKNLKKDLKNKGLVVKIKRLRPYREKKFKTHLLRNKGRI